MREADAEMIATGKRLPQDNVWCHVADFVALVFETCMEYLSAIFERIWMMEDWLCRPQPKVGLDAPVFGTWPMVISDNEDDDVKAAMSTSACPVIMAQCMFLYIGDPNWQRHRAALIIGEGRGDSSMHVEVMIIYKSLLQDEATDLEKAEQILSEEPSSQDGLGLMLSCHYMCSCVEQSDADMERKPRKSALKECPSESISYINSV